MERLVKCKFEHLDGILNESESGQMEQIQWIVACDLLSTINTKYENWESQLSNDVKIIAVVRVLYA